MNVTEGFPGGTEPRKRIAPDGDKLEENSRLRKAKSHRADPQVGNESHLDLSADACNNGVQKIHHVKAVPATVEAPPVNGGNNSSQQMQQQAQNFQTSVPTMMAAPWPAHAMIPGLQMAVPQAIPNAAAPVPRLFPMGGVPVPAFHGAQGARLLTQVPNPAAVQVPMFHGLQQVNTVEQPKFFVVYPPPVMADAQARANLLYFQNPAAQALRPQLAPQLAPQVAPQLAPQVQTMQQPYVISGMVPAGLRLSAPPAMSVVPTMKQPSTGGSTHLDPGQHAPVDLYMTVDEDILSDHQIFLRKQIEYFEAGRLEVQSVTHGGRKGVSIGQVGIRCKHCASIAPKKRPKGAIYYPSSFRALYQAAQNMAAGHFTSSCEMIGEEKKAQFRAFQAGKISAGHGGKKYWADCAKAVRIGETEHGLRFQKE